MLICECERPLDKNDLGARIRLLASTNTTGSFPSLSAVSEKRVILFPRACAHSRESQSLRLSKGKRIVLDLETRVGRFDWIESDTEHLNSCLRLDFLTTSSSSFTSHLVPAPIGTANMAAVAAGRTLGRTVTSKGLTRYTQAQFLRRNAFTPAVRGFAASSRGMRYMREAQ